LISPNGFARIRVRKFDRQIDCDQSLSEWFSIFACVPLLSKSDNTVEPTLI
jgi:hypothetical protein